MRVGAQHAGRSRVRAGLRQRVARHVSAVPSRSERSASAAGRSRARCSRSRPRASSRPTAARCDSGTPVRQIERDAAGFRRGCGRARSAASSSRCAPQHAAALLPAARRGWRASPAQLDALEHEPIYTVLPPVRGERRAADPDARLHRRPPAVGVRPRRAQRTRRADRRGAQRIGRHEALARADLAAALHAELAAALPGLPPPLWTRVIAEKRATFSCRPGVVRPGNATACRGLFLAGDYTASDYPATLESAVRSGVAAAELAAPVTESRRPRRRAARPRSARSRPTPASARSPSG